MSFWSVSFIQQMFLTTYYVQDNVLSIKYSLGACGLGKWNMERRKSKPKITETVDYLHVCLVPQRGHRPVLLLRPNPSGASKKDALEEKLRLKEG